jgi:anaerobic ribonucleoside-triphosphate reductase activating protein
MKIRIFHWTTMKKDLLGPGNRSIVWVQGCSLKCPDCIIPEAWDKDGGYEIEVDTLLQNLLNDDSVDGVTVTGGEPTLQANAVFELLYKIRSAKKNTWMYSGYTIEELIAQNNENVDNLLTQVDVLVDGRYDKMLAGTFMWKGSSNQRELHLTKDILYHPKSREHTKIEISLNADGKAIIIGIPPQNFLHTFKNNAIKHGLNVKY